MSGILSIGAMLLFLAWAGAVTWGHGDRGVVILYAVVFVLIGIATLRAV